VGLQLVDFHQQVLRAGFAELGLDDQVRLEVLDVGVEHRQSDDAGNNCGSGDHDGKECHAAHLPLIFRFFKLVHFVWGFYA
jgi:hypothetical protein